MHLQWKEVFLCLYPIYTLETSFTSFSFICCLKKKKRKAPVICLLVLSVSYEEVTAILESQENYEHMFCDNGLKEIELSIKSKLTGLNNYKER